MAEELIPLPLSAAPLAPARLASPLAASRWPLLLPGQRWDGARPLLTIKTGPVSPSIDPDLLIALF